MSQENVKEVVRGTEAGARGDREARGDVLAVSRRCTYCSVRRLLDAERLGAVGDLCRPGLVVEVGLPDVVAVEGYGSERRVDVLDRDGCGVQRRRVG